VISRDPLPALTPVVEMLERLGVAYCIGGSLASSAHGFPRSTNDADVVADLQERHVKPLVTALIDAYYVDEDVARDAVQRRVSFNLIHLETMFKIDVFASGSTPYDRLELDRRIESRLGREEGGRSFAVASPEDTVLRKLKWYRDSGQTLDQQWRDVQDVLAVQADAVDRDYLRRWAPALGVTDLLEKALLEAELAD